VEQKAFLFETIAEPAEAPVMRSTAKVIATSLSFTLHSGSLTLVPEPARYDAADAPLDALAKFYFHDLSGRLERRAALKATKLSVTLGALHLDDLSHSISAPIKIIAPKRATGTDPMQSSSSLPFLTVVVDTLPEDVQADIKFRLVSQPLEITLLPVEIMRLLQFFKPQWQSSLPQENVLDTASFIDADLQVAKFSRQAQRSPVLDVLLEISAPQVSRVLQVLFFFIFVGALLSPPRHTQLAHVDC
jgi:hypothetical protein